MKHNEIYDKHSDQRKKVKSPNRKRKLGEGVDRDARLRRVSFKNYVRELEEELLDDEIDLDDEQS